MTIPEHIVPNDINNIITRRNQQWDRWKASQADVEQLNVQSARISQRVLPEPVSPITQNKTPPAELRAMLPLLKNTLTQGDRIRAEIAEHQEAIRQLKRLERRLLLACVIVGIIILLFVAYAIHLL